MVTSTDQTTLDVPAASPRGMPRPSWRSIGILIPFVVLFVALSIGSPHFFTAQNLLNILDQQSGTLIIAAAGTLVLIAGGIDLSVGATYTLAAVVSAQVVMAYGTVPGILAGLAVGLAVGAVNGVVSTVLRINSLIATLAMSFIVAGLASIVSGGSLISLRATNPDFNEFAWTRFIGIVSSIWIALVVVVVLGVLLARTTIGRYIYAAGGNAEAARLAGIRVYGIRILTFTLSGVAAGLAGVLSTSKTLGAHADPNTTLTFIVLAGIVVGGTSILGGEGAIWRTVVGVLFIALVYNGFNLLRVDPLFQQIALGLILLLAVGIDAWSRVRRR